MSENKNSYTKFMIMKKLYKDGNKQVYLLSNKNGYKKGKLSVKHNLNMGEVIEVEDSIEGTCWTYFKCNVFNKSTLW